MSYDYYNNLLETKTNYLNPQIKETDLYQLSRGIYLNQGKVPCECVVSGPNLVTFKYQLSKDVGFHAEHEVFQKNVIKIQDNYGLAYSESREFNSKHHLVNLKINIEFILAEKVRIVAERRNYGIIFQAFHLLASEIDSSYQEYAHIPITGIEKFYLIPYGDILYSCYSETIQLFEDFYSGIYYPKNYLKKYLE